MSAAAGTLQFLHCRILNKLLIHSFISPVHLCKTQFKSTKHRPIQILHPDAENNPSDVKANGKQSGHSLDTETFDEKSSKKLQVQDTEVHLPG